MRVHLDRGGTVSWRFYCQRCGEEVAGLLSRCRRCAPYPTAISSERRAPLGQKWVSVRWRSAPELGATWHTFPCDQHGVVHAVGGVPE